MKVNYHLVKIVCGIYIKIGAMVQLRKMYDKGWITEFCDLCINGCVRCYKS